MTAPTLDVVGIGNAIVDVIATCDDAFLETHGATKGHMRLVDAETVTKLYAAMGPATEMSGGSAANTIVGIASLGGKPGYIGKVAADDFGDVFGHDLRAAGVTYDTAPSQGETQTARCLVLVTPDGERTMNTYLGVSPELDADDLDETLIQSASILYLEGYLFDRDQAQAAFYQAAEMARAAGRKVALTLSDGFCVDRHRDAFKRLLNGPVDILFANEAELYALQQSEDFDSAAATLAESLDILAVTRSGKGSVLFHKGAPTSVQAAPIAQLIDTTGAGDLYAAGVLFGISRGLDLETSGKIGSLAAAEIIQHVGARPQTSLADLAKTAGLI